MARHNDLEYIKSFEACIEKLRQGNPSKTDIVFATTGWLQLLNDWGGDTPEELVSRRTVWSFSNGYQLVVPHLNAPVLVNIKKEYVYGHKPLPEDDMVGWRGAPSVNGYRFTREGGHQFMDSESLVSLIEKLTGHWGEPKLLIPWKKIWTNQWVADYDEESFQHDPNYLAIYRFAVAVSEGKLKKASPWALKVIEADEYMPKWCHYKQFRQLLEEVQKRKIANVQFGVWEDEISEEAIQEIRAGKDKYSQLPIIWIPKWTADQYLGDGCISAEIRVDEPEVEKKIIQLANELKLDLTYQDPNWSLEAIEDESWESTGIITAESEPWGE